MSTNGPGTPEGHDESVGSALARLRKDRRLTGLQMGRLAGVSQATISRLERGKVQPDPDTVRRIAIALHADPATVDRLVEIAERAHDRMIDMGPISTDIAEWQRTYGRQELNAHSIRVFQPEIVIGLLQSSEYAREVLSEFQEALWPTGDLSRRAVADAVQERMQRQVILTDHSKTFEFLLTETALNNRLCRPEYMPGQIERIREVARQPNVTVGIVPAEADWPIAPMHGFTVLDEDTVLIDLFNTGLVSRGKTDNMHYRRIFAMYKDIATNLIDPILDRYATIHLERMRRIRS